MIKGETGGQNLLNRIEANPVIAAVRSEGELQAALDSPVSTVFLLHADIFNLSSMVDRIQASGKSALVHMDFLEGLGRDNRAIDYLKERIRPDGIISTKSGHVKYAREQGLFAVQRFFLIDSQSYENSIKTALQIKPHMVEVMPGIIPRVLERITKQLDIPIIAGGLIETKEEVVEILKAGAWGISTGNSSLWRI